MDAARAVDLKGVEVLLSAVSFVLLEAVMGPFAIKSFHDPIARHFGDDGGRRNRYGEAVSLHDGCGGDFNAGQLVAVDEQMIGLSG